MTLVIDQGSHASRIAVFSENGELVLLEAENISTHSAGQNLFEHDAGEILDSIQSLLNKLPADLSHRIKQCGLCTQRSTIVAWHRLTGEALAPAISWRDLRAQPFIDSLNPMAAKIRKISGLPLSAHYSAGKMHWLLQHHTAVQQAASERQLCIAPLASFLLFHLLKEKPLLIDDSNAQRSQLFDIQTRNWSDELISLFQLEKSYLPECKPVIYLYGRLKQFTIPVTAVCGDQNAVLYAYPQLQKNNALINIGTGAFILSNSADRDTEKPTLLHTITSSSLTSTDYITEGTVNGAGAALSWAQNTDPCDQVFTRLPRWLEQIDSPPVFINTISGLGSPWWYNGGQAEFIGGNTENQGDRYVAIIESIVFLIFRNIQQLETHPQMLFISGGLSRLDGLCQRLADLSQARIFRFADTQATARGCAWQARQLLADYSQVWEALEIDNQFSASENTLGSKALFKRYQQFVGELEKRRSND